MGYGTRISRICCIRLPHTAGILNGEKPGLPSSSQPPSSSTLQNGAWRSLEMGQNEIAVQRPDVGFRRPRHATALANASKDITNLCR